MSRGLRAESSMSQLNAHATHALQLEVFKNIFIRTCNFFKILFTLEIFEKLGLVIFSKFSLP